MPLPESLLPVPTSAPPVEPPQLSADELDALVELAASALAPNTRRTYRTAFAQFASWCDEHAPPLQALPAHPLTVAAYLRSRAAGGVKRGTLMIDLAAIGKMHQNARQTSPTHDVTLREVLRGLKREISRPPRQAPPILTEDLRKLSSAQEVPPRGTALARERAGARDRAILLLGFAGAFRRSEIADIRIRDLALDDATGATGGMTVYLPHSKTDQEGEGALVEIPRGSIETTCPVRAILHWLDVLALAQGVAEDHPLFQRIDRWGNFRSPAPLDGGSISRIVKRAADDADLGERGFSGHSLRAGLATSAAMSGAGIEEIMAQTRHKSVTVAMTYIRLRRRGALNVAARVGL